jgi:hypothetical protein
MGHEFIYIMPVLFSSAFSWPSVGGLESSCKMNQPTSRLNIPLFQLPWPGACASNASQIEEQMIAWAEKYDLLINKSLRERVARTKYGWLAARCYPNAGLELLQTIADYFIWFFLADDLFVDRVDTFTTDTLTNLTAMINVLDFDRAGSKPVYGELAWLDVCQRLRKLMPLQNFERFANGMRLWATAAGLQILNHLQAKSIGIAEYETIRRHTSGMNPCLALADVANMGPTESNEFYDPEFQSLCCRANNIVCWSNDIQSLEVEILQPGQFRNMVVIYASQGLTLQEAVDCTATRVNNEISQFMQVADNVFPRASVAGQGLIDGFKFWIHGYQDWVIQDTKRYSAQFAAIDADDRFVL